MVLLEMTGIIAVHVGAGCHSTSLYQDYKKLMKNACKQAIYLLQNKQTALDAVCCATQILENSSLTNAGYGSSLTINGTVECDASIMDGKSLLSGAVGAVHGVTNPVILAKELLLAQQHPLPGGLIPPSFLAGTGARSWAVSHNIEVCHVGDLITEKSKKIYEHNLSYLNKLEDKKIKKMKLNCVVQNETMIQKGLLDTVGAVCIDLEGNVASAVSSGGLLLKQPGRVGQAAVYGSGCWSENNCDDNGVNVSVSTSGCGEHLIRTMFARMCAKSIAISDDLGVSLSQSIKTEFLESKFLDGVDSRMGGGISLRYNPGTSCADLYWFHTTPSMGISYMTTGDQKAQVLFSELQADKVGKSVVINCKSFNKSSENPKTESL